MKVATCKFPVPVAFVNVIPASDERPEILSEAPCKYPEAVMLVEEIFASDEINPESLLNWEMLEVVSPMVPVEEIVILFPPEYPIFDRALDVLWRSERLLADWRKKPVV